MTKVLRLHHGTNTLIDWQNSVSISPGLIKDIADPEDGNAKKEITSIPSPFARIDLVKTAFAEIVNNNTYDCDGINVGDRNRPTIYHKMVSDSLDVGEIFFNYENLKDKIQILIWDKVKDLNLLFQSTNPAHNALGKTLDMFLKQDSSPDLTQDAEMYNFHKMKCIYLLNYIGKDKPAKLNIIGATSPSTLFFCSANNLDYVSKNISFDGQDRPFDDDYRPLYKRDVEFIKYLWALKVSNRSFAQDFTSFNKYLEITYQKLSYEIQQMLDLIDSSTINNYDPIKVSSVENCVEILGTTFHGRPVREYISSDFEISTTKFSGKRPLILPIESGNTYSSLKYTQSTWGHINKAPIYDKKPWKKRTLPIIGLDYPYLTISDFLEDTIIRMPYQLNHPFYFHGNLPISEKTESASYLLPIKDLFFEFFSTNDLIGEVYGGKKMIEMKENSGGILVTLRIPIKGDNNTVRYIEYQRKYFENNAPDLNTNLGALIQRKIGLGILPAIKFSESDKPHYRIAFFDKAGNTRLDCYNGAVGVPVKANVVRREKDDVCSVESYVIEECFDRIIVNIGEKRGAIIPILKSKNGGSQFTFAIDFGTTNTHIEYSVDNAPTLPFSISNEDKQMQRMHIDYRLDRGDIGYAFDDNFIPDTIGIQQMYKFPIRTAFAEWRDIDYKKSYFTLASGNIPFRYEKAETPLQNKIKTELKWSTQKRAQVKLFIENIFIMLRNKVLLNGGNLKETKLIWFYPASMSEAQCNNYKNIWHTLYKEYFAEDLSKVIAMSESVAPYSYYSKKLGAKANVVTIDVGGGTTDVYVVENRNPKLLSSFRFASNAIFGDGYNWDSDNNGFVKIYREEIVNTLIKNDFFDLQKAFESIERNKSSNDINAFFFALAHNKSVKDKNIPSLNYLDKLTCNEQLKYVYIIFYSAILYYVANLMKVQGLKLPTTIAFSGNGSKTLQILSTDKRTLAKFAKLIFEKVYDEFYDLNNELEIIYDPENPKEATSKGGILAPVPQSFDQIDSIKFSLLGVDTTTLTNKQPFSEIDTVTIERIVLETKKFINFIFAIHDKNDNFFSKKFNADAKIVSIVKSICYNNLIEYATLGLDCRKEELKSWGAVDSIEETLFFLPLVGMLNNLAREISNLK